MLSETKIDKLEETLSYEQKTQLVEEWMQNHQLNETKLLRIFSSMALGEKGKFRIWYHKQVMRLVEELGKAYEKERTAHLETILDACLTMQRSSEYIISLIKEATNFPAEEKNKQILEQQEIIHNALEIGKKVIEKIKEESLDPSREIKFTLINPETGKEEPMGFEK